MKKLLPAILAIIGLATGTGTGIYLKPEPDDHELAETAPASELDQASSKEDKPGRLIDEATTKPVRRSDKETEDSTATFEYVKLNNQFIVPVVSGSKIAALVVMSLSIEVTVGQKEAVFIREPKLRDAFLQVLFDHANSGGFDGMFTTGEKMDDLRGSLFEVAVQILGPAASDVLVIDIVRQDI